VLRLAAPADVDLHEGAGLLRQFPRRGALAGGDAHDDRADLARLAGLEAQFLGNVVALVEEADHRDALVHRSRAGRPGRSSGGVSLRGGGGRARLVERDLDRLGRLGRDPVATGKRQRQQEDERAHPPCQLSAPGVQAS